VLVMKWKGVSPVPHVHGVRLLYSKCLWLRGKAKKKTEAERETSFEDKPVMPARNLRLWKKLRDNIFGFY